MHYYEITMPSLQKHQIKLRLYCWCRDCRGSQRSDVNKSPTCGEEMSGIFVPVYFMREAMSSGGTPHHLHLQKAQSPFLPHLSVVNFHLDQGQCVTNKADRSSKLQYGYPETWPEKEK